MVLSHKTIIRIWCLIFVSVTTQSCIMICISKRWNSVENYQKFSSIVNYLCTSIVYDNSTESHALNKMSHTFRFLSRIIKLFFLFRFLSRLRFCCLQKRIQKKKTFRNSKRIVLNSRPLQTYIVSEGRVNRTNNGCRMVHRLRTIIFNEKFIFEATHKKELKISADEGNFSLLLHPSQ